MTHVKNGDAASPVSTRGASPFDLVAYMRATVLALEAVGWCLPVVWWCWSGRKMRGRTRKSKVRRAAGLQRIEGLAGFRDAALENAMPNGWACLGHLSELLKANPGPVSQAIAIASILCWPGLILIDNGHFQYVLDKLHLTFKPIELIQFQIQLLHARIMRNVYRMFRTFVRCPRGHRLLFLHLVQADGTILLSRDLCVFAGQVHLGRGRTRTGAVRRDWAGNRGDIWYHVCPVRHSFPGITALCPASNLPSCKR